MKSGSAFDAAEFRELLARLSEKSSNDYYNPYTTFEWPESIPDDALWMSPELLSISGTEVADEYDPATLNALGRWESVNFYSLNVHGIRDLIIEVVRRIHSPGFEVPSEFFHHFIGEENEHMWFFAKFCQLYGGKVYPNKSMPLPESYAAELENFLVFARILVFEQIVDYYNVRMAADERLHPTVRQINRIHHQDESRHIAFGARLVRLLWSQVVAADPDVEQHRAVGRYLQRYFAASMESFYNPSAYRDAGVSGGFALRQRLLADPVRQREHAKVLRKTTDFFHRIGVPAVAPTAA